jgi:NodT family efflux transporter outer membrane factor (OMF) lipoprotein
VVAADRLPKIDANAGAVRERINFAAFGFSGFPGLPAFSNPTISLYSVGATVSYGLDLFGLTRRRIEVVGAQADAEARRADAAYLALTGNVALQVVRIAGLREEIAVLGDIVADDRASIDVVRAAQAAGGESRTAGLGGQAQLEADQALAPPVERDLAQARHQLAGLVGRSPATWTAPDFAFAAFTPPTAIPVALPSGLVRGRPDILAAEADVHADTARIGVATANLYPNINLVAGLTQEALTPGSLFSFDSTAYDFGAQVTAPIFHGGALRAERRAAQAEARASLARYRQTVSKAFVQVADVLTNLAEDDKRLATASSQEATARAALSDAETAYRLGGGPRAQIVVARRRLDQIRLSKVESAGRRLEDIVALYAATATDWGHASNHG